MKRHFLLCFLATSFAFADMDLYQHEPKISVDNNVLTKVNETTISVLDLVKKMDLALHQNYPQHADIPQARFQFYSANWRPVLMEMINTELILSDAKDKEVKLTDGDVREEMESRFGPNVLDTLEKIGLTYDDAWKMVKNELTVQRMMWFFVHSKAIQSVTPQAIRDSYRNYLIENPAYQEWAYRVISIRADSHEAEYAQEIHQLLLNEKQSPESALSLQNWEKEHPDCKIQISSEYNAKDTEVSEAHRTAVAALSVGDYSQPIRQASRSDQKTVYRIFYLSQKTDHPATPFDAISHQLKNELVQRAIAKESDSYLSKLQKHYGFDPSRVKETVPDNLQPFHLE